MNDSTPLPRSREQVFDSLSDAHALLETALLRADPTLDEAHLRSFAVWCAQTVEVHGDYQKNFQIDLPRAMVKDAFRKRLRESGSSTARAACAFALGRQISSAAAFSCVYACTGDDPVDVAKEAGGWAAMYALITTSEASGQIIGRILRRLLGDAPWLKR